MKWSSFLIKLKKKKIPSNNIAHEIITCDDKNPLWISKAIQDTIQVKQRLNIAKAVRLTMICLKFFNPRKMSVWFL